MPPPIRFPLAFLHHRLDGGTILSECLFFPEISRLGHTRENNIKHLSENIAETLKKMPTNELYHRRLAVAGQPRWVVVTLDPPRRNIFWKNPVKLRFAAVVWSHGEEATVARVPMLGIEVIVPPGEEVQKTLEREILAALRRTGAAAKLEPLTWLQRGIKFRVDWQTVDVAIPTLKQRGQREKSKDVEQPKVLPQVATLLNNTELKPGHEVDDIVEQLADGLTAERPQSLLLVGPSGVGKTSAVRELIRQRELFSLRETPFYQTSGAKIVAGQTGFGMWQERAQQLVRELAKLRGILHIGNLVELMEVGKSEHNQTGIAGFLRPFISRGELLCIAECTPEQVPMIEKEDPQLMDAFRSVKMEEPNAAKSIRILSKTAEDKHGLKRIVTPAALAMIDQLHRRYATYSAIPGRPIRFMENLRRDGERREPVTETDVLTAFARETGLPRVLLDPAVPLDPDATRDWFKQRVIGQTEAVELVSDLLATIKAGLTRPNRPIASLLFIGPTGVGKTEMAKALAEFLFASKDRLTRFDMSEFGDPISVRRLVGGVFGSEGLLTAKVREQPFCVLLLDEFEKAHPSFQDLMLQMLGEARLTDAGGRLADFRNAVIILTSNLGAETFQMGTPGFGASRQNQSMAKQHFIREVEKFLRPEMFNRLDRLVPFAPLDSGTIRDIAKREWDKVLNRDGIRFRDARFDTADGVVGELAAKGFDPRYGARPLKRAMERELLAPLAHQMNRHDGNARLEVKIAVKDGKITAGVKALSDGTMPPHLTAATDLLEKIQLLRRMHQALEKSTTLRELSNDSYQLEQIEKRVIVKNLKQKPINNIEQQKLAELGQIRDILGRVVSQRNDVFQLEEDAILRFHTKPETVATDAETYSKLKTAWDELMLAFISRTHQEVSVTHLALYGHDTKQLMELFKAYIHVAQVNKIEFNVGTLETVPASEAPPFEGANKVRHSSVKNPLTHRWGEDKLSGYLIEDRHNSPLKVLMCHRWTELATLEKSWNARYVGLHLWVRAEGTLLRLQRDAGLHKFQDAGEKGDADILVQVRTPTAGLIPPEGVARRGSFSNQSPVRIYRPTRGTVQDTLLEEWFPWHGDLGPVLNTITERHMKKTLEQLVLE
ncbi:AAA family ATPase [Zavarzinella formosa]|uniref:AAA family ATPase n=1 Tax=Zavarzinella formosa TaxID=360055 RepID=UPI0002E598DA|nr:AAA family ATPase [Zavarzinella formosa]